MRGIRNGQERGRKIKKKELNKWNNISFSWTGTQYC